MAPFFKNKTCIIFLAYAGLVITIYAQVVFFGKSLLPNLFYRANNSGCYDYNGRRPVNIFNIDLGTPTFEIFPINKTVKNIYKKGNLPLWDPYQGCGTPLAAQYSSRAFFVYQVLENMFPYWTWDYFMLARLVIAGFFTYFFLKSLGTSIFTSFLGGVFYMLSGSMIWFVNLEQFANVAMTVPIVLFCFERMIKYRTSASLALSSIAIALMLLAGQPEIAIYVFLLVTAYCFFRIFMLRKQLPLFFIEVLRIIIAFLLGLGLAAILILPFFELYQISYNCHPFGGAMGTTEGIAPLGFAISLFLPITFELPTYYRFFPHNGIWDYLGGYSGVLMIFLFLLGFFYKKNQYYKYLLFFGVFGFLVILKNFGCPFVLWIGRLPLLDQSWSPRWAGPVWTFSLACAGAIGLEMACQAPRNKKYASLLLAFGFLLLFFLYYLLTPFWVRSEEFIDKIGSNLEQFKIVLPTFLLGAAAAFSVLLMAAYLVTYHKNKPSFVISLIFLSILELWFWIPKGMGFQWRFLGLIPFTVGILSILALVKEKRILAIFGMIVVVLSIIMFDILSPHGLPKRSNCFSQRPYIKFLQEQKGYYRITGLEGALMPNFAGAFGIFDVRYIDALSPIIYQDYVDKYLRDASSYDSSDKTWFTGLCREYEEGLLCPSIYKELMDKLAFYSFLGLKYILTPSKVPINLPLVYDNEIKIYENPFCLPRVFLTHDIEYASSYIDAQKMIGKQGFDLRKKIVLEEKPLQINNEFSSIDNSRARIEDYQSDKVVIEAQVDNPGILVLTDIFYPGWEVYVNNQRAKIYRVNGLVRGVFLGKGNHVVIFKYSPNSFKIGLGLSGFCGLICVVLLFKKKIKFF